MSTIGPKVKSLSIVIPVYNEERYILTAIEQVMAADSLGLRKEIIIVDDGSTDTTARILSSRVSRCGSVGLKVLKSESLKVKILRHEENMGKGEAIKTGILKSTGDLVLIQDADLEYSPSDYPKLLEPFMHQNADVVYGSRFVSTESRRVLYYWHSVANSILTTLSNMMTNLNLTDMETGYKVFAGPLIRNIAKNLTSNRFGFEPEVTARIAKQRNLKIFEIGISYSGRTYAEGKKIGWKDAVYALYAIIRYNLFR